MTQQNHGPDLVAVLEQLRRDLSEAKLSAEMSPDGPMLTLGKAEIEMEVAIQDTSEGGGGIKFNVISLGAKKIRAKANTHRLRIELNPLGDIYMAPSERGRFEPPPASEKVTNDRQRREEDSPGDASLGGEASRP
jgi:hypothetical protein